MVLEPIGVMPIIESYLEGEERVETWKREMTSQAIKKEFCTPTPTFIGVLRAAEEDLSKLDHNSQQNAAATTIKISPVCSSASAARKLYLKCKQPPFFKSSLS